MKKSTKKTLAALVIVLIFGMSSIAYVVASLQGTTQTNTFKPLEKNVIDTPIDPTTETTYIQNQYTFLRFYYINKDALYYYTEQLPDLMAHPSGPLQLFVNRIEANETKAEIVNLNGVTEVADLTDTGLFDALCENLMFTPTDCLLRGIETTANEMNTSINQTNSSI